MILVIGPHLEAHLVQFPIIQAHLSCIFTILSIPSAYAGTDIRRRLSIKSRIFWNKLLGTATSANWNVT